MEKIKVVSTASHSYLPGMRATIVSMLRAASCKEQLEFNVLTTDLTEEDREALTELVRKNGGVHPVVIHKPDLSFIENIFTAYKGNYISWMCLFVCEFFKLDDWVVFCDSDTLWFKDVAQLWQRRRDDVSVFWCNDIDYVRRLLKPSFDKIKPGFDLDKYANVGVMLMNLKYMRDHDLMGMVREYASKFGTPFYCDQDVLNYLYNDTSVILDQTWNCLNPQRNAPQGCVIHCLGIGHMFNGPMKGWKAYNAIWYRFYNRYVLGNSASSVPWFKWLWFSVYGLCYPSLRLYRLLTIGCLSYRADQLLNLQFFAWLYRRLPL